MSPPVKNYLVNLRSKLSADITEVPEILKPSHLPGLDGLRAISIGIVVAGHALIGTQWVNLFYGRIGVEIFFVISGFIITTLLLKEKVRTGRISLRLFYIRRALRIFPVAYLYLLCLIILNQFTSIHTTLPMLLGAGLYVGNFPVANNWQTSHFWSLAVEEQFYLVFPFILVSSIRKYLLVIAFVLVTLPFIVMLSTSPPDTGIIHKGLRTLVYLLGYGTSAILIGSLTAILLFKGIIGSTFKPKRWLTKQLVNWVSILVFICAWTLDEPNVLNWNLRIYIFPALIACVIVLTLKNADYFSKFLNHPLIVKIGVLSYSIYIWQQLFTQDQPWKLPFSPHVALAINMILLGIVSYASYTLYEKKFLKLKKHFASI
jgi:peptidoglycan/LPS O-acetylase OafA/YrhL